MDWKTIIASAGAGICLGTGLFAILQGHVWLGIPITSIWGLNVWILFKPVKELVRVMIASAGVGVSFGLGVYAGLIGQTLFCMVLIAVCLANLIILVREAGSG